RRPGGLHLGGRADRPQREELERPRSEKLGWAAAAGVRAGRRRPVGARLPARPARQRPAHLRLLPPPRREREARREGGALRRCGEERGRRRVRPRVPPEVRLELTQGKTTRKINLAALGATEPI